MFLGVVNGQLHSPINLIRFYQFLDKHQIVNIVVERILVCNEGTGVTMNSHSINQTSCDVNLEHELQLHWLPMFPFSLTFWARRMKIISTQNSIKKKQLPFHYLINSVLV